MERVEIARTLDEVAGELEPIAKEQVETEGFFNPVVVLIYEDKRREYLYPRFTSEDQRQEAFEKVNRHISDTGALGAVLLMETWFYPKNTTGKQDALFLTKRAWGINEFEAWSFERRGEKIEWLEHMGPRQKGSDMLITAFREMH